jgi:hypothetical protein
VKPAQGLAGAFFVAGLLLLVIGVVALGLTALYQGLVFLKYGAWQPISAAWLCSYLFESQWCAAPTDWHGLHRLMVFLSPGAFAVAVAAVLIFVGSILEGRSE